MAYGTTDAQEEQALAVVEESSFQQKEAAIEENGDANKKKGYGSLAVIGLLGVACVGATVTYVPGGIGFGGRSAASTSELTDALKPCRVAISETVEAVGDLKNSNVQKVR